MAPNPRPDPRTALRASHSRSRLTRLSDGLRQLTGTRTPEEVIAVALGPCVAALGARGGALALFDEPELELRVVRVEGEGAGLPRASERLALTSPSPLAEVARLGQPVFHGTQGGGGLVVLPLPGLDQLLGVLALAVADLARFDDPSERALVEVLAQHCALALDRARTLVQERTLRETAERDALLARRLIGVMGHDLRNPLHVISVAAQLLGQPRLPATSRQRAANRIATNVQRMGRIIEDLLDFTRIQTEGQLPVSRRPVDLRELLRELVSDFRMAHGVRIGLELSGDLEGAFDPVRLSQLFSNLLHNAVRYGDPPRPISVNAEGFEHEVRISVHNHGAVIPESLRPALFEPFRRGPHHELERSQRGLGLGLFIVRQIAVSHGGTVEVTSSEQEGTRFTVALPRRDPLRASGPAGQAGMRPGGG
ncbi:MAG: GAF domain-containing sensor histidine kinase [Myxococcaceae bacterium]|nr:GAF domain-containing sensor histidine kinase [Myxococcaceae bacterium]